MTRHHRLAAYTLSALLALAAASCGGDDTDDPPPTTEETTAPTTTTPPTTALTAEQEVEAAFAEFAAVLKDQASEPNPEDERLDALLVDPLLARVRTNLAERRDANQVYEVSPESRDDLLSVAVGGDGTATAEICSVTADRLVDEDSGVTIQEGTFTLRAEASFRRQDGRWMVSDLATIESWDGVRQCV